MLYNVHKEKQVRLHVVKQKPAIPRLCSERITFTWKTM